MGIKTDLSLVGDQYQWLGSLFYFGMPSICSAFISYRNLTVQAISHGNIQPASFCSVFPWANTRLLVLSSGEWFFAALLLSAISLVELQFGSCMAAIYRL